MGILTKKDLNNILALRFKEDICNKFSDIYLPSVFKDIYSGAFCIKKALEKEKNIVIVGDYDVDGIISCVILSEFFDNIGSNYRVKIPNRFKDGYGLNENIINELDNVDLIITVDNGITAFEAALLCEKKNIDLVITDHHMPGQTLPKAKAIINPKQKDCGFPNLEICGAVVTWYFIAAIKEVCKINYDMSSFIDLLGIATIADMMELRDLNRLLVKKSLNYLNNTKRIAIKAIKQYYKKEKLNFDNIGFLIAPLINSAGRMNDAILSYNFLRAKDYKDANILLDQLISLNNARKNEEKITIEESLKQINPNLKVIVVSNKNWHDGVLGIVASRLAKCFKKPTFVFSENEENLKGSARSIGNIDILKLIQNAKDIIINYGGHKGAAGLSIKKDKLKDFENIINEACLKIPQKDFENSDEILGELDPKDIDLDLCEIIENFEPFGYKNPLPLFEFKDFIVTNKTYIGQKHLKLNIIKDNIKLNAIFFNYNKDLNINDKISFIASINKNTYKGFTNIQIMIKDLIF